MHQNNLGGFIVFIRPLFSEERWRNKESSSCLDPFEGSLERHETVDLGNGWNRRVSFGIWTLENDGTVTVENVPEHGHGPVLTYIAPIHDLIIECEFQIPETPAQDRHFRIFIDEDGYRGHNIQSTANLSSVFRPVGFTLAAPKKS